MKRLLGLMILPLLLSMPGPLPARDVQPATTADGYPAGWDDLAKHDAKMPKIHIQVGTPKAATGKKKKTKKKKLRLVQSLVPLKIQYTF